MKAQAASNFYSALLTILVAAASFCTLYWVSLQFQAGPNAAILAAVLALSMGRKRAENHGRSLFLELGALLGVGVLAGLVAWLLYFRFYIGAPLFVVGMFLSLWLRRFDGRARQAATLIALPLVAALVAPGAPHAPGGPLVNLFLVLAAAVISFAWERLLRTLFLRTGLVTNEMAETSRKAPRPERAKSGIAPTTRMALQMAVALTASFVIGRLWFPEHWGWIVLTAFIVCSGSIGRGEAVYKGLLRFGGALGGVLAATLLQFVFLPQGPLEAVLIFAVLFLGLWLRERNYAWWAGGMTLVVALLYGTGSGGDVGLLGERLLAIFIGALCGIAASWFVLPIKTESLVRRRLADALLALEEWVAAVPDEREHKRRVFEHRLTEFGRLAPPVRLHRCLLRPKADDHPAVWIELVEQCAARARALAVSHPDLVRAIRGSRKALAEPDGSLTPALRKLHALLAAPPGG
ncbi:MAG TPA: FUSC family protein [Gammaproteobacteria bacterium]|nr:FUSC family protein [Gammaproteobacteria bacterium]